MSEAGRTKFVEVTRLVVPITALGAVIGATWIGVGFLKDTQSQIAATRAESNEHYAELVRKFDELRDSTTHYVTETAFENWRLRVQWANRAKDIDLSPEFRR